MLFPFLLLVGVLVVAREVTKAPGEPLIKVGQNLRITDPVFQTQIQTPNPLPPSIVHLSNLMQRGIEPPRWLIDRAIHEAYNSGRWDVVQNLAMRFPQPDEQQLPDPSQSMSPDQREASDQADTIGTVIGKNSPIEGVSNEDWNRFVDQLSTQDPAYCSDRHVGQFHHSKARLQQLGIDPSQLSPDDQYGALVRDLTDYHTSSAIDQLLNQTINVDDDVSTITLSGALGLLKSAGPDRARSWVNKPGDRSQYKMTTEMFKRTNGIF